MKNTVRTLLIMILSLFLLVGCSGFTSDDPSISVTDGTDGSVIITFINEDGEEETHVIKRGEGLAGVKEVPNPSEGYTSLIFLFENGLIDVDPIKIPYPEDGREVKLQVNDETRYIEYQYDGDEEWIELFDLSELNGKSAYEIYVEKQIEKGEDYEKDEEAWLLTLKGENGKSAYEIYVEQQEKKGEAALESEDLWIESLKGKDAFELYKEFMGNNDLTMDDYLESLKGDKGKEVVSITSMSGETAYKNDTSGKSETEWLLEYSGLTEDELKGLDSKDFNVFIFTYNDETVSDPVLELRSGGRWYTGNLDPNTVNLGLAGDYYFNKNYDDIYYKRTDGKWEIIASLNPIRDIAKVYFDLNVSTSDPNKAYFTDSKYDVEYFEVIKGEYFRGGEFDNPEIPIPQRAGYKFIGWYRVKTLPENYEYVYLPFNDFTVVAEDELKLYAQWEKIE